MNEQTPETGADERIEFSEQDKADLAAMGVTDGEVPEQHPILEIWRETLKPAREQKELPISPQWAVKIVSSYPQITFFDMPMFRDLYFGWMIELADILDHEIATDADCLTYRDYKEDAEENAEHYKNVLRDWQLTFLGKELDWDPQAANAAVVIGVLGELHKTFFGNTGLTQFLENIPFQYTDEDHAALGEALNELRAERVAAHQEG